MVAVWLARGVLSAAAVTVVHEPVPPAAGVYSSTDASTNPAPARPPTARTWPSDRRVAVCWVRAWASAPAAENVRVAGS